MSSSYGKNSRSGSSCVTTTCHHHRHRSSPSPSYLYNSYYASSPPSAAAFASSTTSAFGSVSRSASSFHHQHQYSHSHHQRYSTRPTSPIRVNLVGSVSSVPYVRFSLDSPSGNSPNRSIASVHQHHQSRHHHHSHPHSQSDSHGSNHHHHLHQQHNRIPQQQKRCMCSPTTHPGSFRCSLHKNVGYQSGGHHTVNLAPSNRLNAKRSAMTNSLVRIGTVEGELVKRALSSLIRPSSNQQKRRASFQRRPSRLSIMSMAGKNDLNDV